MHHHRYKRYLPHLPKIIAIFFLHRLVLVTVNAQRLFNPQDSGSVEDAASYEGPTPRPPPSAHPPYHSGSGGGQPPRNVRARYDSGTGNIFVEWDPSGQDSAQQYLVRYRVTRGDGGSSSQYAWREVQPDGRHSARLEFRKESIHNGDEIVVQVKSSSGDWSDPLTISIERRGNDGFDEGGELAVVDEGDLLPPLNFTANVLGPTTVRLDWSRSTSTASPPEEDSTLYYILSVRQLTGGGHARGNQEIRVEDNTFMLGDLQPGEGYEVTIRTASSPERVSSAAAIVEISMPRADDFFEVGNLIISSRFKSDGSGVVNLTWEVPPAMTARISAYDVRYARADSPSSWRQVHFSGATPTALLHELRADTDYVLKIKTMLVGNLQTESGEFRFRTPHVAVNPISKLDVIYSSDTNAVRLQWTLAPHVSINSIAGYDVYINEDQSRPEHEWRHISASGSESQVAVDGLRSQTTYYARINVRNGDGTVLKSPSIYKFTTIEQLSQQQHPRRGLSTRSLRHQYPNVGSGSAWVRWVYPQRVVSMGLAGSRVYYTEQANHEQLPLERWQRVTVESGQQRAVLILGLREGSLYHVRVVPVLSSGEPSVRDAISLQIRAEGPEE